MTRNAERLVVREMIGALKGRHGWTDRELARRLGCSRGTIANMKTDPGRTKHETIRALTNLYEGTRG